MSNKPLIYDFKTESGNHYVYDACSNYTYPIEQVDIDIINNYHDFETNGLKEKLFEKYSKAKVEQSYKKVSDWVKHDMAFFPKWDGPAEFLTKEEYKKRTSGIHQLIIEVTQKCNLRCKYCIYNTYYHKNRDHGNIDMKWEIAKRCIDYFLSLINKTPSYTTSNVATLYFYGGEPLMNFRLIKKSIEYVESLSQKIKIQYGVTTNLTRLNKEIARYLIEKNVSLLVSLDGPADQNDKFRVFKNGKGTYNCIMKKLDLIRCLNEKYYDLKVKFNAVFTHAHDLQKVIDFYHSLGTKNIIRFASDFSQDIKSCYKISKEESINFTKIRKILFKKFIELEKFGIMDNDYRRIYQYLHNLDFFHFRERTASFSNVHKLTAACCIPGTSRIYATVDGNFQMCPNIDPGFEIGNCWTGLSYWKICQIYNNFKKYVLNQCHDCISVHFCPICQATTSRKGGCFEKDGLCNKWVDEFKKVLKIYYSTLEENPNAFVPVVFPK